MGPIGCPETSVTSYQSTVPITLDWARISTFSCSWTWFWRPFCFCVMHLSCYRQLYYIHCISPFHADFNSQHHNPGLIQWHNYINFLLKHEKISLLRPLLSRYVCISSVSSSVATLNLVTDLYDTVYQYYVIRGHLHPDLTFATAEDRISECFSKPKCCNLLCVVLLKDLFVVYLWTT
jgi:hypothetical protein